MTRAGPRPPASLSAWIPQPLGDTVWVDEILLEEASGSAALLLKGELSYQDKDLHWGPGGLGRGLSLGSDLSAAWSDYSYLSGGSSLATAFGALKPWRKAQGFPGARRLYRPGGSQPRVFHSRPSLEGE